MWINGSRHWVAAPPPPVLKPRPGRYTWCSPLALVSPAATDWARQRVLSLFTLVVLWHCLTILHLAGPSGCSGAQLQFSHWAAARDFLSPVTELVIVHSFCCDGPRRITHTQSTSDLSQAVLGPYSRRTVVHVQYADLDRCTALNHSRCVHQQMYTM